MADLKQFNPNKNEKVLKNSADNIQVFSFWNSAVDHGNSIKEIDENLYDDHNDKQKAELLLRRKDTTQ